MALFRAFLAGTVVFLLFLGFSESLPLVWDEGDTIARTESILYWKEKIVTHQVSAKADPWSGETLRKYIPSTISYEGHPAGYLFVTALGKEISSYCRLTGPAGFLSEKLSYRFGPIFLWGLALGVVFYRLEKSFSLPAAFFGTISILLLPRIFTHVQIAFGDSVLISSWLLAWGIFPSALRNKFGVLLWGIVLGFTASAKFTGALAPIPFFLWLFILPKEEFRKHFLRFSLIGIPVILITFCIFNPPIWDSPFSGLAEYFRLNTHRGNYNIGILFLGKMYNLDHPLPWWNPFFWTFITIPAGLLISGLAVLFTVIRKWITKDTSEKKCRLNEEILLVLNWLTLILIRTIPGLPVHDGIRLFAASFPFFGLLAGLGLACLWERKKLLARSAALAVLFGSASSVILYFPQELSYYNLLIGGLPGAVRAGMEAAYYWDGLDREIVSFLKSAEKKDGPRPLLFSAASYGTLSHWKKEEEIVQQVETISRLSDPKTAAQRLAAAPFRYYILQFRGGGLTRQDRQILRTGKPLFIKTAGQRKSAFISGSRNPWNLRSVPLILVYPYDDFLKACQTVKKE